jgi:hypothetical protein
MLAQVKSVFMHNVSNNLLPFNKRLFRHHHNHTSAPQEVLIYTDFIICFI